MDGKERRSHAVQEEAEAGLCQRPGGLELQVRQGRENGRVSLLWGPHCRASPALGLWPKHLRSQEHTRLPPCAYQKGVWKRGGFMSEQDLQKLMSVLHLIQTMYPVGPASPSVLSGQTDEISYQSSTRVTLWCTL